MQQSTYCLQVAEPAVAEPTMAEAAEPKPAAANGAEEKVAEG